MYIMDRLTDKVDWNKKIFNEEIVAKWRVEAKQISDVELWNIAMKDGDEWSHDFEKIDEEAEERDYPRLRCLLEGIVNDNTFDCVSESDRDTTDEN